MAAGIYGCKNDCGNVRLKNSRRKRTAVKMTGGNVRLKNSRRECTAVKMIAENAWY